MYYHIYNIPGSILNLDKTLWNIRSKLEVFDSKFSGKASTPEGQHILQNSIQHNPLSNASNSQKAEFTIVMVVEWLWAKWTRNRKLTHTLRQENVQLVQRNLIHLWTDFQNSTLDKSTRQADDLIWDSFIAQPETWTQIRSSICCPLLASKHVGWRKTLSSVHLVSGHCPHPSLSLHSTTAIQVFARTLPSA